MTRYKSRITAGVAAAMLLGAVAAAAILARVAPSASEPRQLVLVARDMAFYLDGQGQPNPAIHLRRRELVRIVLRNDDPGMLHDFGVRAWKAGTRLLTASAEDAIVFRVPDKLGVQTYSCTPHGELMRGTIVVE